MSVNVKDFVKIREFPENNYRGIFIKESGKTIRQTYDSSKPITPLEFPEFLDISITSFCAGKCPQCYTNALNSGHHFTNVPQKINDWFGGMSENEKIFQTALGGSGEPTSHPQFVEILKTFRDHDIVPNYTTNGMHLTDDIIEGAKKYAGGVALSCHKHLARYWSRGISLFTDNDIRTCLHIIIGENGSVDYFSYLYEKYKDKIEYFVLLPYSITGRAKPIKSRDDEFKKLFNLFKENKPSNIAFGALFYPYFLDNPQLVRYLDVDIYEPEILSGYVMLDDEHYKDGKPIIYKSSFDLTPKF